MHSRKEDAAPYRLQEEHIHSGMMPSYSALYQRLCRLFGAQRRMVGVIFPMRVFRVVIADMVDVDFLRCSYRVVSLWRILCVLALRQLLGRWVGALLERLLTDWVRTLLKSLLTLRVGIRWV